MIRVNTNAYCEQCLWLDSIKLSSHDSVVYMYFHKIFVCLSNQLHSQGLYIVADHVTGVFKLLLHEHYFIINNSSYMKKHKRDLTKLQYMCV